MWTRNEPNVKDEHIEQNSDSEHVVVEMYTHKGTTLRKMTRALRFEYLHPKAGRGSSDFLTDLTVGFPNP